MERILLHGFTSPDYQVMYDLAVQELKLGRKLMASYDLDRNEIIVFSCVEISQLERFNTVDADINYLNQR